MAALVRWAWGEGFGQISLKMEKFSLKILNVELVYKSTGRLTHLCDSLLCVQGSERSCCYRNRQHGCSALSVHPSVFSKISSPYSSYSLQACLLLLSMKQGQAGSAGIILALHLIQKCHSKC